MVMVSAAPVLAADHLMKVGEVMLANAGGSTAVQFIELEDPGETFPNPPYKVEIYGAGGGSTPLITYTVSVPAGTTRHTLATTQAATDLGFTSQTTLTQTLPASGWACFGRGASVVARIHCFGWGTITGNVVAPGSMDMGAAPPNGMSVQRVAGVYSVAAPTPGAANSNGTVDMPPVDAPPMADAALTPDAPLISPDAPGGNGNNPPDDDGCSVGAGASWFGLSLFAVLLLVRRSSTRRRR